MKVNIKGQKQLERELQRKFGKVNVQRVSDLALKAGAEVFVKELKSQYNSVNWATKPPQRTGAIIDEITISEPYTLRGVRTIRVHWKGPKNRYALVHLNEFGTVNNPNPPAKGTIAKSLKAAENAYRKAIRREIERGI